MGKLPTPLGLVNTSIRIFLI